MFSKFLNVPTVPNMSGGDVMFANTGTSWEEVHSPRAVGGGHSNAKGWRSLTPPKEMNGTFGNGNERKTQVEVK